MYSTIPHTAANTKVRKKRRPDELLSRATPRCLVPVAQVFNLCPIGAPLGVAHAPSPDVRVGPPGLRSLRVRRASPSMAPLAPTARLAGHGQPLAVPVSYKPKAVRPRVPHVGRGVRWRFTPRLTALGLDRCVASASRTSLAACRFQPRRRRKAYIADARPMPESTIAGGSGTASTFIRMGAEVLVVQLVPPLFV